MAIFQQLPHTVYVLKKVPREGGRMYHEELNRVAGDLSYGDVGSIVTWPYSVGAIRADFIGKGLIVGRTDEDGMIILFLEHVVVAHRVAASSKEMQEKLTKWTFVHGRVQVRLNPGDKVATQTSSGPKLHLVNLAAKEGEN